jgi:hypothetical protein
MSGMNDHTKVAVAVTKALGSITWTGCCQTWFLREQRSQV